MIRRVLDSNNRFAYLPHYGGAGPQVGDVGVVAEVIECELLHDGRATLQAKCRSRFRVRLPLPLRPPLFSLD